MNYPEYAKIALQLIAQAGIKADDRSIDAAKATRQMLRDIADGTLVVGTPLKDEDKQPGEKSDAAAV